MMTVAQLKPNLLDLSVPDRAELATFLLESLPEPNHEDLADDDDGLAESIRRSEEADRDPSVIISQDEFEAHFKKRLGR